MRRLDFIMFCLSATLILPSFASAQAQRNTREAVQNETQILKGRMQLDRDQRELKEFERLLGALDGLDPVKAKGEYMRVTARLRQVMEREHMQSKRKLVQSNVEVGQSRRERRGERQEANATGTVRDHMQLRDDRRDLRDDRRDHRSNLGRTERMADLVEDAQDLEAAVNAGEADAMVKNRRLLGEFLELMRSDLRETATELDEDIQERREDRRERRTDRAKQ